MIPSASDEYLAAFLTDSGYGKPTAVQMRSSVIFGYALYYDLVAGLRSGIEWLSW